MARISFKLEAPLKQGHPEFLPEYRMFIDGKPTNRYVSKTSNGFWVTFAKSFARLQEAQDYARAQPYKDSPTVK